MQVTQNTGGIMQEREQKLTGYNFTAPYEYREYPKAVTLADGTVIVVNDAAEEQAAIGEMPAAKSGKAK